MVHTTEKALESLLKEAAFGGWNQETLEKACGGPESALALFPGGIADAVAAYCALLNAKMESKINTMPEFDRLKIRQKIREGLWLRFTEHQRHREATRQLLSYYALPHHLPAAARHAWEMADKLWYLAGDTATDYNHYTKRTLLSGIYSATLLSFVTDDTPDLAITSAFLDRRIEDVMKIEGYKKQAKNFVKNLFG